MRAAVIGSNWGAVHVAALRDAGVEVVAIAGRDPDRTRLSAERLGVPGAVSELTQLAGMELDLITIATPPATHASVLAELPDLPVICEKPAVGVNPLRGLPPGRTAPVWVNYAFGFLDAAEVLAARHADLGPIEAVEVTSSFDLPGDLTQEQWFCELATHPWSWVVSLLGSPKPDTGGTAHDAAGGLGIATRSGPVQVLVQVLRAPGLAGIAHEVTLHGRDGTGQVRCRYRVGGPWKVAAPTLRTGSGTVAIGRAADGQPDPWYQANARSFSAIIAAAQGQRPAPNLFDWPAALALDSCVQDCLTAR